ncbi:MAG: chorismate mutase [Thermomicrobiales bacterium]
MSDTTDWQFDSLEEIRERIDEIDAEIVNLIGQRAACVHEVIRFKSGPEDAHRPDRVEAVIASVRAQAMNSGADPDLVEQLYRHMISWFTESEIQALERMT